MSKNRPRQDFNYDPKAKFGAWVKDKEVGFKNMMGHSKLKGVFYTTSRNIKLPRAVYINTVLNLSRLIAIEADKKHLESLAAYDALEMFMVGEISDGGLRFPDAPVVDDLVQSILPPSREDKVLVDVRIAAMRVVRDVLRCNGDYYNLNVSCTELCDITLADNDNWALDDYQRQHEKPVRGFMAAIYSVF